MSDDRMTATTPRIERVKYEIRRRELTIAEVSRLSPHMIRVTLRGDELADFASAAADGGVSQRSGRPDPATKDQKPGGRPGGRRGNGLGKGRLS